MRFRRRTSSVAVSPVRRRAREERARSEALPTPPFGIDHASFFLHRFFARAGEAGMQHVTGMAVTRFGTFITALRFGGYKACVTSRGRRTSSMFSLLRKSCRGGDGTSFYAPFHL